MKDILTIWAPIVLFVAALCFLFVAVLARRRDNDRIVNLSLWGVGVDLCLWVVLGVITGLCSAYGLL